MGERPGRYESGMPFLSRVGLISSTQNHQVMTLDPLSPWNYESVLTQWAKVKLTDRLWKTVLTNASGVSAYLH